MKDKNVCTQEPESNLPGAPRIPGSNSNGLRTSPIYARFLMNSPANTSSSATLATKAQPVARFAWLTLAYNIVVILWGAYVRATGSGAGCGNHWPLCNSELLPGSAQAQTVIEIIHRITSGLALVMVFALLVWCWRRTSKGDWPRYSAALALILLLNEALLGALLVVFDHVAEDQSTARALFLSLHFGNTLLLLASLSLTAQWLSNGNRRFRVTGKPRQLAAIGLGLLAVMSIGITGVLAALGDTVFPHESLRSSLVQDFSSNSPVLLRLRLLHPLAAVIGALYVLWIIFKSSGKRFHSSWTLPVLTSTLVVQGSLGALNVMLLAPQWLQIVHLFVADLFWILLVVASAELMLERVDFELVFRRPTLGA
jgi:heme a synthase